MSYYIRLFTKNEDILGIDAIQDELQGTEFKVSLNHEEDAAGDWMTINVLDKQGNEFHKEAFLAGKLAAGINIIEKIP